VHAEVGNGTEVIFTAADIFGWTFEGWYKGADVDGGGQLISNDRVATIDVYDPYSTMIDYYAVYTFDDTIRPGRYIELSKGFIFDFVFYNSATKLYDGSVHINKTSFITDYYFIMPLGSWEATPPQLILQKDPRRNQPEDYGFTFGVEATAIGMQLTCSNATQGNVWGIQDGDILQLKWLQG
jgi:hypothetical protein